LVGIWVYLRYPRTGPIILGFAAGIFIHQLLDELWLWPTHWFWPAFGSFTWTLEPNFAWHALWEEVTSPTEWIAGILILTFIVIYFILRYRKRYLNKG
jgi:hypothetical protein